MNQYKDETRGLYQREECAKQLISFEGLVFRGRNGKNNVTPTDIDGCVQLDAENCFIFFELKHSGGMPTGQKDALAKLCDAVAAGGKNAVVIMAIHNVPVPEKILAKNAIVDEVYWNSKWHSIRHKQEKLGDVAKNYIDYIKSRST